MTEHSFASKLFHVIVITLIAIYVVFVQKSQSTVESVVCPDKTDHAPSTYSRKDRLSGH